MQTEQTPDRKFKKADLDALVASDGREILVVQRHTWGRGKTGTLALKQSRKSGGSGKAMIFDVPAGTQVDGMGRMTYWPPEGRDWDTIEAEDGKSPSEWAAIVQLGTYGR